MPLRFRTVPHLTHVLISYFTELPCREQSSSRHEGAQGSTNSQAPLSLATCSFDFARVLAPLGLVGVAALADLREGSDFRISTRLRFS